MKKIAAMVGGVAFTFAAASVGAPPRAEAKDKASMVNARREKALKETGAQEKTAAPEAAQTGGTGAQEKTAAPDAEQTDDMGAQEKAAAPDAAMALKAGAPGAHLKIKSILPEKAPTLPGPVKRRIPGPSLKEEIAHCANTTLWKDGECVSKSGNYIVGTSRADIASGGELSCSIRLKRVPHPPHPEYIPLADAELAPWLDEKDCFRMEFFPTWPNPTRGLNDNQRGFWYTRCYGFGKCIP